MGAVTLVAVGLVQPTASGRIEPAVGYVVVEASAPSPGVQFERWRLPGGPVEVRVARLSAETVRDRLRVVVGGEQLAEAGARRETTTSLCLRYRCVAAINADYWALSGPEVSVPTGAVVANGEVLRSGPTAGYVHAVVGANGALDAIGSPLVWTMRLVGGASEPLVLSGLNRRVEGGVVAFTARWSAATPVDPFATEWVLALDQAGPINGGVRPVSYVERRTGGGTVLADDRIVLRATAGAVGAVDQFLAANGNRAALELDTGGVREVSGASPQLLDAAFDSDVVAAVAAATVAEPGPIPVTDPAVPPPVAEDGRAPRTMIGWDLAGTAILVTVDGRQPGWSRGVTLLEGAQLLRALGAVEGVNLDGGGSTSFVEGGRLTNRPSDGVERPVTTALVVGPPEGWDFAVPVARGTDAACPPGRVPAATYFDVVATAVHGSSIACVSAWRVAAGVRPQVFDPGRPTTRGQMATFLARVLILAGLPLPASPPNAFADDDTSIHAASIDALAALGIVGGRADASYGPDDTVTRGQMAAFLTRTYAVRAGAPLGAEHDYFADDSLHPFERDINIAAGAGLTGGTASGDYSAGLDVTRAQMATFLARLLDSLVAAGLAAPPF